MLTFRDELDIVLEEKKQDFEAQATSHMRDVAAAAGYDVSRYGDLRSMFQAGGGYSSGDGSI